MGFGKKLKHAFSGSLKKTFSRQGIKHPWFLRQTRSLRHKIGLDKKGLFPFTSSGFYADSGLIDNPYGVSGSLSSKFR